MFLMWTYEQLSKVQINVSLFRLFVTIFTFFLVKHSGDTVSHVHTLEAVLDCLPVAWSVFWKLRKRGARVCTVILLVGRIWNTLWYLCLRCLYIRNGGGVDFSGRPSNRPITDAPGVVWACLPACPLSSLPFTIYQIVLSYSQFSVW